MKSLRGSSREPQIANFAQDVNQVVVRTRLTATDQQIKEPSSHAVHQCTFGEVEKRKRNASVSRMRVV